MFVPALLLVALVALTGHAKTRGKKAALGVVVAINVVIAGSIWQQGVGSFVRVEGHTLVARSGWTWARVPLDQVRWDTAQAFDGPLGARLHGTSLGGMQAGWFEADGRKVFALRSNQPAVKVSTPKFDLVMPDQAYDQLTTCVHP